MRSTIRSGVRSTCLTLSVSPDSVRCGLRSTGLTLFVSPDFAGSGLGRARVVSRRRVLFSFFGQIFPIVSSLFLRMNRSIGVDTFYTNLGSTYTRNKVGYEQVGSSPSDLGVRGSNPGWCFFFCVTFPFFLFQCKNMVRTVFYTPGTYMCMYHYD